MEEPSIGERGLPPPTRARGWYLVGHDRNEWGLRGGHLTDAALVQVRACPQRPEGQLAAEPFAHPRRRSGRHQYTNPPGNVSGCRASLTRQHFERRWHRPPGYETSESLSEPS